MKPYLEFRSVDLNNLTERKREKAIVKKTEEGKKTAPITRLLQNISEI